MFGGSFSGLFRSRAYVRLFCEGKGGELNRDSSIVLGDLNSFCHATSPIPQGIDAIEAARLEGRREVYLRIMDTINYDFEKFYQIRQEAENDRATNDDY